MPTLSNTNAPATDDFHKDAANCLRLQASFQLAACDNTRELVIEPTLLFLGTLDIGMDRPTSTRSPFLPHEPYI